MRSAVQRLLDRAVELACPASCASCEAPGGLACPVCLSLFTAPPRQVRPDPCPPGLPPTWSVVDYGGAARDLLLAYKERGAIGLGRPLAQALTRAARCAAAAGSEPVFVVPVPSSAMAVRARGDDVVALLARLVARSLRRDGQPARAVAALRQARTLADSAGLSAAERQANLAGALVLRPSAARALSGRRIVIIDDLLTTGATLTEAARALTTAGVTVTGAATLAATRRRTHEIHN